MRKGTAKPAPDGAEETPDAAGEQPKPNPPGHATAAETDDEEHPIAEPDDMIVDGEIVDPRDVEITALKDKLARARADYVNLQRRTEDNAALERERIRARILEPFVQVFEYGQMAMAEADKSPGPLAEGIKMVVRELERLLESEGLKAMGTVGEAFDAARHEAIGEEALDGASPGSITRVVQPGYLIGKRILRYAKVMVAPHEDESYP